MWVSSLLLVDLSSSCMWPVSSGIVHIIEDEKAVEVLVVLVLVFSFRKVWVIRSFNEDKIESLFKYISKQSPAREIIEGPSEGLHLIEITSTEVLQSLLTITSEGLQYCGSWWSFYRSHQNWRRDHSNLCWKVICFVVSYLSYISWFLCFQGFIPGKNVDWVMGIVKDRRRCKCRGEGRRMVILCSKSKWAITTWYQTVEIV